MNKRYLLISKSETMFWIDTELFYTLEEAEITAKNISKNFFETTIIDLENIKWKGNK
ncbi:hypothetical protein [Spiroplasma sp. ChiS]|uniref:hypothetical protein n=1 Tax=Spiroplasma sp. ChiS TaxID=2099885 RepID=UPI00139232DA|nr:hypothetical protein [Spiroplasma sp. ChiS]